MTSNPIGLAQINTFLIEFVWIEFFHMPNSNQDESIKIPRRAKNYKSLRK